jgi:hypothetical protein
MLEDQLSEKHRKRKARKRKILIVAIVVLIAIIAIGIFWFIFKSPFWQIRAVAIHGNSMVAAGDIKDMITANIHSILGTNDILAWPSGALPASETALIPELAAVSVSKSYFGHSVDVSVTERQPFAIWCEMPQFAAGESAANGSNPMTNENCFWFDASGTIFEKAYDTEGSELFAVHDYSQTGLGLGQSILPDVFVANLISILDVIKASGLTIKEVALNDLSLQEIDVSTYDGPDVYFSLRFSADNDLPVLQSLMAKPDFKTLQYVDFRVENRAYYK